MNNTIQTIDTTMQEPTQFDLNSIFIAALSQAITQATAPLVARIATLERSLAVADKAAQGNESDLFSRVATLEEQMIAKQDSIDERIKEIADEVARDVLSEHSEEYDHDGYDRLEERIEDKVNDAIEEYDFDDKIKDVLNGASLSISV
jgi:hypothetical protein